MTPEVVVFLAGIVVIGTGLFVLFGPFLTAMFGLPGADPSTSALSQAGLARHVIPGLALTMGGIVLLPKSDAGRALGGLLVLVSGVWLLLEPVVWLGPGQGFAFGDAVPRLVSRLGTGTVAAVFGALGLGAALGRLSLRRELAAESSDEPEAAEKPVTGKLWLPRRALGLTSEARRSQS